MIRIILLVSLASLMIVGGVLLVVLMARRRWNVRLALFGWGALAFIAAQAVHIPVLAAMTLAFKFMALPLGPNAKLAINVVVLGGTAGLFEELARYFLLRWPTVGAARPEDAIAFGLGHGGFEAICVAIVSPISAGYLLLMGDSLAAASKDPAIVAAIQKQLASVHEITLATAMLPVWERALAVMLHVALTLVVWSAVKTGRRALLGLAILWHAGIDGCAVIAAARGMSAVHIELGLTAASVLSAAVIWHFWPRPAKVAAAPA